LLRDHRHRDRVISRAARSLAVSLVVAVLTACSSPGQGHAPGSAPGRPSPHPVGRTACAPASPQGDLSGEVYATAMSGSVWAWFMESWPPRVGREDKTVWRIEGPEQQAQPTFTLRGPGGAVGRLDWGPQEQQCLDLEPARP